MTYTITQLARLTGVTSRTLRYYHQIGLLVPQEINSVNGYRLYTQQEVDRLWQILFFKQFQLPLTTIKEILAGDSKQNIAILQSHLDDLEQSRNQLTLIIDNAKKTIANLKGELPMSNQEKFQLYKEQLINDNEQQYGAEIREKYGDESIDASNKKLLQMSQDDFQSLEELNAKLNEQLIIATTENDPHGPNAQKLCQLHEQWLKHSWSTYSKDAHRSLAQMYVDDERFKKYYDNIVENGAVFLRDALYIYLQ